jgi:hypothetical protein
MASWELRIDEKHTQYVAKIVIAKEECGVSRV